MQIGRNYNIKWEMDGKYYNLWSTDNDKTDANDDVVIKSVYDPSPVGYSLPASNAFTGFTDTGLNTGNPGNPAIFNVKGSYDKGWYYYTQPNRKGNTIFFPVNGSRQHNGVAVSFTFRSDATTATPSSTKQNYLMTYGSTYIYPLDNYDYRSWGFPVRSAEEKKWRYAGWRKLQMMFRLREVYDMQIGESCKWSMELNMITMKGLCERSSLVSRTMCVRKQL